MPPAHHHPEQTEAGTRVPGTAAGLTDIVAEIRTHLNEAGAGQHARQQLAVAGLQMRPLRKQEPRLADSGGEFVADLLELAEVEHPRLSAATRNPVADLNPLERAGEKARELSLKAADLSPQLGARGAFVASGAKPGEGI